MRTIPFLLLAATALHAASDADFAELKARLDALEKKEPSTPQKFNLFIDALFFKATDDSLAYASPNPTTTVTLPEGRSYQQTLNWGWGYRLRGSYRLPHDGWDIAADFLHFGNSASNNTTALPYESLYSVRLPPSIFSSMIKSFSTINSSWRLRLNQVDLGIGRECVISRFFKLRPNFGVRYSQIHQNFTIDYFQVGTNPDNFTQKQRNNFWGIGPFLGIDTTWSFSRTWSFYADADLAAVYGKVKAKNSVYELTKAQLDSVTNAKPYATRPMVDIELGIRFQKFLKNHKYLLGFNLGWEEHIYFAQNQLQRFVDTSLPGTYVTTGNSLTLQGVAFGADFTF